VTAKQQTNWFDLDAATARLPGRPSRETIRRWYTRGLRGGTVKLRVLRAGGKVLLCEEWFHEFCAALAGPRPKPPRGPTPRRQRREHEAAMGRLRAAGVADD
jgi:hypothetical protein